MYNELIDALRNCADTENIIDSCDIEQCKFHCEVPNCIDKMMRDAADAIEDLNGEINRLKEYEDKWEKLYECVYESFLETLDSISWEGDPNIKVFKETEDEV